MKKLTRLVIILSLFFTLKIIHSCGCPDNTTFFDFSQMSVRNLDNSQDYVMWSDNDTMYSAAVAFEVTVSGSENFAFFKKTQFNPGFKLAKASECPIIYVSNQIISRIRVITQEEISPAILAGTDVTGIFLTHVPNHSASGYLYSTIEKLYDLINTGSYPDHATATFRLFCTEDIRNSKARFTIIAELSDGRTLAVDTEIIYLLQSQ
jgi:hypothetical protein